MLGQHPVFKNAFHRYDYAGLTGEKSMDYTEKAREMFSSDIYAVETTGVRIEEARPDYCRCSLKIDGHHFNVNGNVMGGAIFTLADYAFGVAANVENPSAVSLTPSCHCPALPHLQRLWRRAGGSHRGAAGVCGKPLV